MAGVNLFGVGRWNEICKVSPGISTVGKNKLSRVLVKASLDKWMMSDHKQRQRQRERDGYPRILRYGYGTVVQI